LCACVFVLPYGRVIARVRVWPFSGSPLQRRNFERVIVASMFGFFCLSIKMQLAKPSRVVLTTAGIMMPVILPGFSSRNVYVSFGETDDMLEYWHNGAVPMLKLKTARGILRLNVFLMQTSHFEELRRFLG
jgi:hypothetical protein